MRRTSRERGDAPRWQVALARLMLAGALATSFGVYTFGGPRTAVAAEPPTRTAAIAESARGAPAAALDADPVRAFESANAAFAAGHAAEAADAFAAIAKRDGSSPALLFNLGNASFRAGRIGQAVLAFERALVLDPGSEETRANLRQVRQAAALPLPEPTPWQQVVDRLSANGWAWLASLCLLGACLAAVGARAARAGPVERPAARRLLRAVAGLSVVVGAVAVAGVLSALAALDRGVVLGAETALRVAPYASATSSHVLTAGEVVELERAHEGFVLVRTADDKSGWIERDRVGRIGDIPGPGQPL